MKVVLHHGNVIFIYTDGPILDSALTPRDVRSVVQTDFSHVRQENDGAIVKCTVQYRMTWPLYNHEVDLSW